MAGQRRHTVYMPLDEVLRAPRNPKLHAKNIIAGSMSHFGVVELPALDERTGRLVAGHGRLDDWQRRRDTGENPPDGVDVDTNGDWLVPVTRGWASRSDMDAEAYLIVSNRSTELGGYDNEGLAEVLVDLRDEDADLLALTGYDEGDVDDLVKLTTPPDLDELADALGEPEADDAWPVIRLKVPPHVAAAWRKRLDLHDGSELAAFAALLDVDPHWAPVEQPTPTS